VRAIDTHMTRDITVQLENGTYQLDRPLRLDPQDSGTGGHDVVWTAAPGANPVISGGVSVGGWKLFDRTMNIWSASVPTSLHSRQVYVNGMRASMAAGPLPVKLKPTAGGYRASSPLMASWANQKQIEFVYTGGGHIWNAPVDGLGRWTEPICPVASIRGDVIRMAQPCWDNSTERITVPGDVDRSADLVGPARLTNGEQPAYVENAFPLLQHPGQFYLDSSAHVLYYIPRVGQNMSTAHVVAARLQTLISGQGTPGRPIHNIVFSHLQFSYATWLQPGSRQGFSEIQANYTLTGKRAYATEGLGPFAPHGTYPYGAWTKEPGNLQFRYDRNLAFIDDRFVHLGAAGLNLDNGSQKGSVVGCVFTDISGNGIEVGNVNEPEAAGASQTSRITIADNHLYALPVEYHGGVAIDAGYVSNSSFIHNQIDHVPYTAISIGWGGWPDKIGQPPVANFSRNNLIADNLIFDSMQVLTDGGGIYTQGLTGTSMGTGERVVGNVIHDQLDWGHALYSDNGSTFITYLRNVAYDDFDDWGIAHTDYVTNDGADDPLRLLHNYWQQGDPDSSLLAVVKSGNMVISGPREVPRGIIANAGLQPAFRRILRWRPRGRAVPNPPERVAAYSGNGVAYVTWAPSYAFGNAQVTSYTIRTSSGQTATIPAAAFERRGYDIMPGLAEGQSYTFSVTAESRDGDSTPSIPSLPVKIQRRPPELPARPRSISVHPGNHDATVEWHAPHPTAGVPVTGYRIACSSGTSYVVRGLSQLLVSNVGAGVFHVFGDLKPGKTYRFSVAAMSPDGAGRSITSPQVVPKP